MAFTSSPRLRFHIGAMLGSLGGLDAVVFTAGVGEHAPEVRGEAALRPFGFLGLALDEDGNRRAQPDCDISTQGSAVQVMVIGAQEEWAIARAAAQTVGGRSRRPQRARAAA